jgi:hypothetical protein
MSKKRLGLIGCLLGVLAVVCDIAADEIDAKMTEQMIDDKIDARFAALEKKED